MKFLKALVPALALVATVSHASDILDHKQAVRDTTKVRQVNYTCATGGRLTVKYGFNEQSQPTSAEAVVGGKNRFMPINLARSDVSGTFFGQEDSYTLGVDALTLGNYHRVGLASIQDPASEIMHKDCRVASIKKIKG